MATSVAERLRLAGPTVLFRWRKETISRGGAPASGLEARVRELQMELRRVERDRDILKEALVIFGRDE